MKNIFIKIEFHFSFLIMALGLVLTGYFSNLIVFTSLIIIHEMGHLITAKMFGYDVTKIIIYPYGGITKLNTNINTNINKDLVVAISGVFFQTIYFVIIYVLYSNGVVREYIYNLFLLYHKSMVIFNLLPIAYLDGFKIVNLVISKFLNFNLSNNVSVFISLVSLILFLYSGVFENNYSIIMVIGLLMHNIYKFYNEICYIYNRFLIERYLHDINYKQKKVIRDVNKMYKNKSHLFIRDGKIIDEKRVLGDFFGKKGKY